MKFRAINILLFIGALAFLGLGIYFSIYKKGGFNYYLGFFICILMLNSHNAEVNVEVGNTKDAKDDIPAPEESEPESKHSV